MRWKLVSRQIVMAWEWVPNIVIGLFMLPVIPLAWLARIGATTRKRIIKCDVLDPLQWW